MASSRRRSFGGTCAEASSPNQVSGVRNWATAGSSQRVPACTSPVAGSPNSPAKPGRSQASVAPAPNASTGRLVVELAGRPGPGQQPPGGIAVERGGERAAEGPVDAPDALLAQPQVRGGDAAVGIGVDEPAAVDAEQVVGAAAAVVAHGEPAEPVVGVLDAAGRAVTDTSWPNRS